MMLSAWLLGAGTGAGDKAPVEAVSVRGMERPAVSTDSRCACLLCWSPSHFCFLLGGALSLLSTVPAARPAARTEGPRTADLVTTAFARGVPSPALLTGECGAGPSASVAWAWAWAWACVAGGGMDVVSACSLCGL